VTSKRLKGRTSASLAGSAASCLVESAAAKKEGNFAEVPKEFPRPLVGLSVLDSSPVSPPPTPTVVEQEK